MNANKQMEVIQEAAGECRHTYPVYKMTHRMQELRGCLKCGFREDSNYTNPPPDDLNALFGYAEKLELGVRTDSQEGYKVATVFDGVVDTSLCSAVNLSDALRNALVQAIEGRK